MPSYNWFGARARSQIVMMGSALASACASTPAQVLWRDPAADGGMAGAAPAAALAPLQAQLQVLQGELACDACSWLVARVEGGEPPYRYEWSDSMLTGPGPQRVCPSVPTSYSLRVSDARATTASAPAVAAVPCVREPQPQDAGADAAAAECVGTQLIEVPAICDTSPIGLPTSVSSALSQTLRAGQSYHLDVQMPTDQLQLSQGLEVDFYLGSASCQPEQWVAQIKLDEAATQPATCLRPERDFDYLIGIARPTSSMVTVSLANGLAVFCPGCAQGDPP